MAPFENMESSSPLMKRGGSCSRCVFGWAVLASVLAIGLLIGIIVVATRQSEPSSVAAVKSIKWCTTSTDEQQRCLEMSTAFQQTGMMPKVVCVKLSDVDDCISSLSDRTVDALTIDAGNMFENRAAVKPILAEDYGFGDASYWAVAVVKKSDASTYLTERGLRNKKSCHTGYQKSAGWKMPMGTLKRLGIISGCDIATSAANLFGTVCAPGDISKLCSGCNGTCKRSCDGENYCGYTGAFRCLVEGGDVAFVKHSTVTSNTDGNNESPWAKDLLSSNFELLCTDGTRAPLSAYKTCNLGKVPSHAVVVSASASDSLVSDIVELLYLAQLRFGLNSNNTFKMFSDQPKPDLLFKSSTKLLMPLKSACSSEDYLGSSYLNNLLQLDCQNSYPSRLTSCVLPFYADVSTAAVKSIKWCTTSTDEQQKCLKMSAAFQESGMIPAVSCVALSDVDHCISSLENRTVDALTIDAGNMFENRAAVKPILAEDYGFGDASYWAVAVVKKSDTTTYLTESGLRNKKSCHTGYQKSAGWKMPMGTLKRLGIISGCDIATSAANLFGKVCAPGDISKLCSGCDGTCKRSCDGENYCGYTGAFRCLVEGGDVAFVKHSTVTSNTDGSNKSPWAKDLLSSNFELLCTDGTRAPLSAYETCNLGKVPSHAVVVSASASDSLVSDIVELLYLAQLRFGLNSDNTFKMFSDQPKPDLLFKSSTKLLMPLKSACSSEEYLGVSYLNNLLQLNCESPYTSALTSCLLPQYTTVTTNTLRWCVTSVGERQKCLNVSQQAQSIGSSLLVSCVMGNDVLSCASKISNNEADGISMDSGEIFNAGLLYNLQPLAAELYESADGGVTAASYYAVAVIRSNETIALTKDSLRGKTTCHTGYERTVGWNAPVGYLISSNIVNVGSSCDVADQVANFFGGSCVPGVGNANGVTPEAMDKLCSICSGVGADKCNPSSEPFRGYSGAFDCLKSGAGDIAFVKQSTVLASTVDQSNYKLLCRDGSTKPPSDYSTCNIEKVPSHAFMVSSSASSEYREKMWTLLNQLQKQKNSELFSSTGFDGNDLLFKDSTKCLSKVEGSCNWADYLGQTYINSALSLKCQNETITSQSCQISPTCSG